MYIYIYIYIYIETYIYIYICMYVSSAVGSSFWLPADDETPGDDRPTQSLHPAKVEGFRV